MLAQSMNQSERAVGGGIRGISRKRRHPSKVVRVFFFLRERSLRRFTGSFVYSNVLAGCWLDTIVYLGNHELSIATYSGIKSV